MGGARRWSLLWAALWWVGVGCAAPKVALSPASDQEREQARRALDEQVSQEQGEDEEGGARAFRRFAGDPSPKIKARAPLLTASGAQVGRAGVVASKTKRRLGEATPQQPTLTGHLGLDLVALEHAVRTRAFSASVCYEQTLKKDPTLRGEIRVAYTVGPKGKVVRSKILKNELRVETADCLERALKLWQLPKPQGGDVDVEQTWRFELLP